MENVIILPSDFPPAESFLVKDPSITAIERIIDTVADHFGEEVIYRKLERRTVMSYITTIVGVYPQVVVLRYPTYDPEGNFRQYLTTSVSYTTLYSGLETITYIERGL